MPTHLDRLVAIDVSKESINVRRETEIEPLFSFSLLVAGTCQQTHLDLEHSRSPCNVQRYQEISVGSWEPEVRSEGFRFGVFVIRRYIRSGLFYIPQFK
jgi:hypothetical protein